MMLTDQISTAMRESLKAQNDKLRLSTLRLMNAAIKDRDIAARSSDRCSGLSDDEVLAVLVKMVKQREESAKTYAENGRLEMAAQERAEVEVIREFLPRQMSDEEVETAVREAIAELGAEGLKDMGKTMGALKAKYAGAMDFGKAGAVLKAALSG